MGRGAPVLIPPSDHPGRGDAVVLLDDGASVAVVDWDALPGLQGVRWYAARSRNTTYARASVKVGGRWRTVEMHALVFGSCGPGRLIDHANRDGLDNRRANLRCADHAQNGANSDPRRGRRFKGVYASGRKARPWRAVIADPARTGYTIHIGSFAAAEEAAKAYDAKAKEFYGEHARTNFPD